MTDREKAIVSAYTGVTMLAGDKFQIFHEYIEKILGRPVWTHELAIELVWNEIKEKSKNDFIEICKTEDKTEERPKGEWKGNNFDEHSCLLCGHAALYEEEPDGYYEVQSNFCPNCGADMRGNN